MGKEMKFNFRELAAEFFGTACLIFVGCGSVVIVAAGDGDHGDAGPIEGLATMVRT